MKIYRFRPDMVYDCEIEVPDGTVAIKPFHTFQQPPVKDGHYAVMRNGWVLVEGEKPEYPPPIDPEVQKFMFNQEQKNKRSIAYREESDPIFFKVQRGEEAMETWLNTVEKIKNDYPYQE